jgi:Flp pilus assembly protein TadB
MPSWSRQPERATEAGRAMSDTDSNKSRNREIARNEEIRQTTGDIRVSAWAIVFAVIVAVIVVGVVWAWIKR